MKNTKSSGKKLKLIAVLSAITICSSLGASTFDASAGTIFSRSSSTTATNSTGCFSGLRSSLSRLGTRISSGLRNGLGRIGIIFSGSSSNTGNRRGNNNPAFDPTGDPTVDKRLGMLGSLTEDDPHMNGQIGTMTGGK